MKMKSKKINAKKSVTESVSDIIAKSCGVDSSAYDPTLCELFSSTKYQAKAEIITATPNAVLQPDIKIERVGKKIKKTAGLSHKDAAEIRVNAKRKMQLAAENIESTTEVVTGTCKIKNLTISKTKAIKTEKELITVKNEVPETSSTLETKKKKKFKIANNDDGELISSEGKKRKKLKQLDHQDQAVVSTSVGKKRKKLVQVKSIYNVIEATQPTSAKIDKEIKIKTETDDTIAALSVVKKLKKLDDDGEEKSLSVAELNKPKDKNPEFEARTVFVGNVPTDMTSKKLKQLFKTAGDIEAIRFRGAAPATRMQLKKVALYRREIHPDRNSIVAFVRYKTREEAEKAVSLLNGVKVEEHRLKVDLADNKKMDNKKSIFVGNLPQKLTDDELWNYFEESCGAIYNVRVVRDAATGMGRGFGFVNFKDAATVDIALSNKKHELSGRPLRVSRAVKKVKDKNQNSVNDKNTLVKKSSGGKPDARSTTWKTVVVKKEKSDNMDFGGDRTAEIGKLKRKFNRPNRGDLKKARIARKLTGHLFERQTGIKHQRNKRTKSQGLRQAKNKLRNLTSKEASKAKIATKKSRNPNL